MTVRGLRDIDAISPGDRELLRTVTDIIRAALPDAMVLLYGSAAHGCRRPDSDYDILVVTDQPVLKSVEGAIEDALFALELECEALISTTYYTSREWDDPRRKASLFHQEVDKDAIAL